MVGGVGARAMGGKLGLGEAPVLMGGGGRGGKAFVAGGFGTGGVGRAGTGLGETPAASWGFPGAGAAAGAAGAVAVCGEVAGRSSILIVPVVRPALATSNAATLSQGEDSGCRGSRLRLGSAITSAAQLSSAVAKSNSCRVLKGTTGPDSAALKEPKNKLWASKPRGSKRGGTGR